MNNAVKNVIRVLAIISAIFAILTSVKIIVDALGLSGRKYFEVDDGSSEE